MERQGECSISREEAGCRLEPENPVERGWDADRTARIRTNGKSSLILITREPSGPVAFSTGLPPSQAEALLDLAAGRVEYLRVDLTLGAQTATLHRFTTPGPLDLITMEFEQADQTRTFQPLPWFGPEVSADPAYQARSMALIGAPARVEVEITDTALESLLDTLDDGSEARVPEPTAQAVAAPEPASDTESEDDDLEVEDSVIRELARSLRPQRR
jgi:CYTH domain-containing protein